MTEQNIPGSPGSDRREQVLDPSAGDAGHPSETIRDEQETHAAGAVPAAFTGEDPTGEDGTAASGEHRSPEDAAREPDGWDSDAHQG